LVQGKCPLSLLQKNRTPARYNKVKEFADAEELHDFATVKAMVDAMPEPEVEEESATERIVIDSLRNNVYEQTSHNATVGE